MKFYIFLLSIFIIKCDNNDDNKLIRAIKFIFSSIQGNLINFKSISFENHYQIIKFYNAKVISPPISIIQFKNNDNENIVNVSNVIFTIIVDLEISIKSYNLSKILYPNSIYEFKYDNLKFKYFDDNNKTQLIENNNNYSLINNSLNTDYGVLKYFKDFTKNETIYQTLIKTFHDLLTQEIIHSQKNFNLLFSNALYILQFSYKKVYKMNYQYNDSVKINYYSVNNIYIDKKEIKFQESIIIFKEITLDLKINLINDFFEETINIIIKSFNDYSNLSYFSNNEFHISNLLKFESKYNEDFFLIIIQNYSKQLNSIIEQYKPYL